MESYHLPVITGISFVFLLSALLLAFFRLFKGPSINDRIAALDLTASVVMGFILVYSILVKNGLYLDIVIVISLISFIGTLAISSFLKNRNKSGL